MKNKNFTYSAYIFILTMNAVPYQVVNDEVDDCTIVITDNCMAWFNPDETFSAAFSTQP